MLPITHACSPLLTIAHHYSLLLTITHYHCVCQVGQAAVSCATIYRFHGTDL